MNYKKLIQILEIPNGLDRNKKKEKISEKMKNIISERSGKICELCECKKANPIHHIIPNGCALELNLIHLCNHCHVAIHILLFVSGKWKFQYRPVKMMW